MIPIGDQNERGPFPWVTYGLIAINLVAFFLQLGDPAITYAWSVIPFEITNNVDLTAPVTIPMGGQPQVIPHQPGPEPIQLTLLTAMFLHGGVAHILGNMLYLFIFGDNVERRIGAIPYLVLYLAWGVFASFVQIALGPEVMLPNLGASGAIAGVLGAYLVFFPTNWVTALAFYYVVRVPAIFMIGVWAFFQFFNGLGAIAVTEQTGGVAYGAHVGGFVAGVATALVVRVLFPAPRRRYRPTW